MITPPALKQGDTIGILSTARKITEAEIAPAIEMLKSWGYQVQLGNTIGLVSDQYAGTDQERAADFQAMMDNDSIQAIMCARGGYGTVHVVDQLDFSKFKTKPKWLVGYSDITVLHAHINKNFGIETIHASMPISFASNTHAALLSIQSALQGSPLSYTFPIHVLNRAGNCMGELVGGNLSVLYSISNTVSDIDTAGKVLFLEDLDEYLYHIDRMMMQLKRSGKLTNLAGLLIGGFSDMRDNTVPFGKTAEEIVMEAVAEYDYPVVFNVPAGHIDDNRALIMGRKIELTMSETDSTIKL